MDRMILPSKIAELLHKDHGTPHYGVAYTKRIYLLECKHLGVNATVRGPHNGNTHAFHFVFLFKSIVSNGQYLVMVAYQRSFACITKDYKGRILRNIFLELLILPYDLLRVGFIVIIK
jgi:hypothetical protein